ncbi:MAG: baseplate J/gp47 family protein [Syntrophomonas sp.]
MLPPDIDPRNKDQIIQYLARLAPFYTNEWRFAPDSTEAGSTLLMIFAEMVEENIKKLNRVQLKNQKAFYNLLGITGLPPLPAKGLIHFDLSAGAKEPVLIPARTQVFAQPPSESEPIPFETTEPVLVTPAEISEIFNLNPVLDRITRVRHHAAQDQKEMPDTGFRAFDVHTEKNLQEHCLYIAQENILRVRERTKFSICFGKSGRSEELEKLTGMLADTERYEWTFSSSEGWSPFEEVKTEGTDLVLIKPDKAEIISIKINEHESYWIRCCVKPLPKTAMSDEAMVFGYKDSGRPERTTGAENLESAGQGWRIPELNRITISGQFTDIFEQGGILPDLLLANDTHIEESEGMPFGTFFAPYNSFYIASEEAFSKKDALISVEFDLGFQVNSMAAEETPPIKWKLIFKESDIKRREIKDVSISRVIWEYWNGSAWLKLIAGEEGEGVFHYPEAGRKNVYFKCPGDISRTDVNGHEGLWIRARVLDIENLYYGFAQYQSPVLHKIRVNYDYCGEYLDAGMILTENNLNWVDRTSFYLDSSARFHPFTGMEGEEPSMLLGFDTAPLKGPINMFFSIETVDLNEDKEPSLEWEYLGIEGLNTGWSPLKVSDNTKNLTKSGIVSFVGPPELARKTLYGRELYWLRLRNRDRKYGMDTFSERLPQVKAIQMNNVYAVQQESISDEYAEKLPGISGNLYKIQKSPAHEVEVWVDETKDLTENEIQALLVKQPERLMIIKDSGGKILKCQVRWEEIESFADSGQNDRHYKLDLASGLIQFGDGRSGMIPSAAGTNKVMVRYKIGGGSRGNLGAGEISQLQSPIAFIDKVTNPFPFGGGCEAETMEEVLDRAPSVLKNRNRAVTEGDFIWIARQASQNIAKIKCLPNYDKYGRKKNGHVTVVILHKCIRADEDTFEELRGQVEDALMERAVATIANSDAIRIIPPAFLEISVSAVLIVNTMGDLISTEKEALQKLEEFLHPVTGNYNGRGWNIGDTVHTNNLYPLLKSISGVKYLDRINITVHLSDKGSRKEIPIEKVDEIPHGLVVNGNHHIVTKLL